MKYNIHYRETEYGRQGTVPATTTLLAGIVNYLIRIGRQVIHIEAIPIKKKRVKRRPKIK